MQREASRTWVKAKKKFTVENNETLGKKNIVNAVRELQFAVQLVGNFISKGADVVVVYRRIVDFTCANELYQEVMKETVTGDWNYYNSKYKKVFNMWHHKLKEVTPVIKEEQVKYTHITNTMEALQDRQIPKRTKQEMQKT